MRILSAIFVVCIYCPGHASSQAGDATPADNTEQELVLPEVDTTGQRSEKTQWATGLSAFHAGDYVTAEHEFKSVARQLRSLAATGGALKVQDSFRYVRYIELTDDGFVEKTVRIAGGITTPKPNLGKLKETFGYTTNSRRHYAKTIHALGLTQIQLGKMEEAEKSFRRAVAYDPYLPDARLRLGLITLLDGETATAERQLEVLTTICVARDCEDDTENAAAIQTLSTMLASHSTDQ